MAVAPQNIRKYSKELLYKIMILLFGMVNWLILTTNDDLSWHMHFTLSFLIVRDMFKPPLLDFPDYLLIWCMYHLPKLLHHLWLVYYFHHG